MVTGIFGVKKPHPNESTALTPGFARSRARQKFGGSSGSSTSFLASFHGAELEQLVI